MWHFREAESRFGMTFCTPGSWILGVFGSFQWQSFWWSKIYSAKQSCKRKPVSLALSTLCRAALLPPPLLPAGPARPQSRSVYTHTHVHVPACARTHVVCTDPGLRVTESSSFTFFCSCFCLFIYIFKLGTTDLSSVCTQSSPWKNFPHAVQKAPVQLTATPSLLLGE